MCLRNAIDQAAKCTTGTTIRFSLSGQIKLTAVLTINNRFDNPILIDGTGQSIALDGDDQSLILSVGPNSVALLNTLKIQNGHAPSGRVAAIYNAGRLSLDNVTVSHNSVVLDYSAALLSLLRLDNGAIDNIGTMTIDHSTIDGNIVFGIVNTGSMTISRSVIARNGTGGIHNSGSMVLNDSSVTDNHNSLGYGGGIDNSGPLTISRSVIANNFTTGYGGGIYSQGKLAIDHSTIMNNSTDFNGGGGIASIQDLTIDSSTIANNTVIDGYEGTTMSATLTPLGGQGGGLEVTGNTTISNSTISGNRAPHGEGGGIFGTNLYRLTISNSTITDNVSNSGAGIFSEVPGAKIRLFSTIIADNHLSPFGGHGVDLFFAGDPSLVKVTSLGYNLIGDGTGIKGLQTGINGDQVGTANQPIAALLDTLTGNGGPTNTIALLPGSRAIGKGNCAGSSEAGFTILLVTTDQRGVQRNNPCDVGAFESRRP